MKKVKTIKKRKFKFRIILYALTMFIGYQISFSTILHIKLAHTNEDFIKGMLADSNYHILYEKSQNNTLNKLFACVLDINNPVNVLENTFHYKPNDLKTYVKNPEINTVNNLNTEPKVYIYNTHQNEAYSGEGLKEYNIKPGVMMASYILQERLAKINIKAIVMQESITDYLNLNNMSYNKSYLASRTFLEKNLKNYQDLKLIIDLHRDSIPKEKSTTIVNNKSCAKISFVIGEDHENYEENLKIAETLNTKIKEKHKELTRGIIEKSGKNTNGVFNQDLDPKIILIEIGGNENKIDEVLNTIDLITPIIGEYVNEN